MLATLIKMLPLVLMVIAGFVLCKRNIIDAEFSRRFSLVMFNLFYPALILNSMLRNFTWHTLLQSWYMPVGVLGILLLGWLIGRVCLPLFRAAPAVTRRTFLFACLTNNYSFLPIILATALWGEGAIALIAFASLGAELCIWTLGVKTLTGEALSRESLKRLLSMPLLALFSASMILWLREHAFAAHLSPENAGGLNSLGGAAMTTLQMLGVATIPASALICGARIALLHPTKLVTPLLSVTTVLRLVIIPAVCVLALNAWTLPFEAKRVLLLIAIQPAAMASVSMAEAFDGDVDLAAASVLATHVMALFSLPLWLLALGF